MKTIITTRQIRKMVKDIEAYVLADDLEGAQSIQFDLNRKVLHQIAFGISDSDKGLAYEAIRAETIITK